MSNLATRRLVVVPQCPRGCADIESIEHVFWFYPTVIEVWGLLNFNWILASDIENWMEQLTWVVSSCSLPLCRLFFCSPWALWSFQNKWLHEKDQRSSRDIVMFIQGYIRELDAVSLKPITETSGEFPWSQPQGSTV